MNTNKKFAFIRGQQKGNGRSAALEGEGGGDPAVVPLCSYELRGKLKSR